MQKLLWVSLGCVLAGYGILGYLVSHGTAPSLGWLIPAGFLLGQAFWVIDSSPSEEPRATGWLTTEAALFLTVAAIAFSVVISLMWFHVMQYLLMIGAAEILARVELRHAGFNSSNARKLLILTSFAGLATGWTLSTVA